jgi:hypothetical protein
MSRRTVCADMGHLFEHCIALPVKLGRFEMLNIKIWTEHPARDRAKGLCVCFDRQRFKAASFNEMCSITVKKGAFCVLIDAHNHTAYMAVLNAPNAAFLNRPSFER